MSDSSRTPPGRTVNPGQGQRASDKLEEMARRYRIEPKRSDSPSPESGNAIRVTLPGAHLSLRPERLKRAFPWVLVVLGLFGFTGASVVGYFRALGDERAARKAADSRIGELEDQFAQVKAVQASQGKRIRALEAAPNAPLVVTK